MPVCLSRVSISVVLAGLALLGVPAHADGLAALDDFLKATRSGRADFTQVVTAPGKDGQPGRVKTSTGSFEFQRPGKFRFSYRRPFEQLIVADGQMLWLHDVDLNQVTARRQAQTLGSTPAALIASAANLAAIEAEFTLKPAPDREGLQWVVATPKARDGQLQTVAVGFRVADKLAQLTVLEILDNFGQRSVISFSRQQINLPLEASLFQFTPPAGADVIKP